MKVQRFLLIIVAGFVLFIFVGFVAAPALTGKSLVDLFNPPKGGNIYVFTIEDLNGDTLDVEVNAFNVSEQAKQVKESGERKWVGGKLILYDNERGFRFDPDTIIIADATAEGLQTTLQGISESPDYWMQFDTVYVSAVVLEVGVQHGIGRE